MIMFLSSCALREAEVTGSQFPAAVCSVGGWAFPGSRIQPSASPDPCAAVFKQKVTFHFKNSCCDAEFNQPV